MFGVLLAVEKDDDNCDDDDDDDDNLGSNCRLRLRMTINDDENLR